MSEPAEIHVRVTRLEERMAEVHKLASRTDREVASWRGVLKNHTKVLNGMSDRLDHLKREMDERFDKVDERFDKIDERFGRMDERFGNLEAKVNDGFTMIGLGHAEIIARLNDAIGRPDDGI